MTAARFIFYKAKMSSAKNINGYFAVATDTPEGALNFYALSEFYKLKNESLTGKQRYILHFAAVARDPDGSLKNKFSVADVREGMKGRGQIPVSKEISAELECLVRKGILVSEKAGGKNKLYQIQNNGFYVWYLSTLIKADENSVFSLQKRTLEWLNQPAAELN